MAALSVEHLKVLLVEHLKVLISRACLRILNSRACLRILAVFIHSIWSSSQKAQYWYLGDERLVMLYRPWPIIYSPYTDALSILCEAFPPFHPSDACCKSKAVVYRGEQGPFKW